MRKDFTFATPNRDAFAKKLRRPREAGAKSNDYQRNAQVLKLVDKPL